ncbi:MAG: hypothetical protein JWO47_943 [Candidatus Saccharibacteria bacterium]|nr:hypothetical protein [Candidatus Saccharibacteria bacterium]
MFFEVRVFKYPEALEQVVDDPAKNVGCKLCPPKAEVKTLVGRKKDEVASPEIGPAADHILNELDNKALFALLRGLGRFRRFGRFHNFLKIRYGLRTIVQSRMKAEHKS